MRAEGQDAGFCWGLGLILSRRSTWTLMVQLAAWGILGTIGAPSASFRCLGLVIREPWGMASAFARDSKIAAPLGAQAAAALPYEASFPIMG